jgi:type III secretion system FlhB-like substrate exporter
LAVALYYKAGETDLPVILVKGRGAGAKEIFKAARQAGVPIIQNISVARRLYPMALFSFIPPDLIEAVAEIIVSARQIRKAAGYDDLDIVEDDAEPNVKPTVESTVEPNVEPTITPEAAPEGAKDSAAPAPAAAPDAADRQP